MSSRGSLCLLFVHVHRAPTLSSKLLPHPAPQSLTTLTVVDAIHCQFEGMDGTAMRVNFNSKVLALVWSFFIFQEEVFGWIAQHHLSKKHHTYNPSSLQATKIASIKMAKTEIDMSPPGARTSLAGDYSIVISQSSEQKQEHAKSPSCWSLFPIDQIVAGEEIIANGAQSMKALASSQSTTTAVKPVATLSCTWSTPNTASISLSTNDQESLSSSTDTSSPMVVDVDLLDLLQRIFVQWSWASRYDDSDASRKNPCTISFFQQDHEDTIVDFSSNSADLVDTLFAGMVDSSSTSIECVEMVTGTGKILGKVPRRLVHTFNILHRGIGLFVTKDRPISSSESKRDFPSLYVHRRSTTKRIFPSLYDMFVGGVSLAGEPPELTARREVAEELGLVRALDENEAWAAPILTCTVCTAYNRCVVTLFSYVMNSQDEMIAWQEEEVDWGSFVPYPVILAAADRSIQRFVNDRKWPGAYPPIQSSNQGSLPSGVEYEDESWKEWDFVPDGLLVWEAWLHFLDHSKAPE